MGKRRRNNRVRIRKAEAPSPAIATVKKDAPKVVAPTDAAMSKAAFVRAGIPYRRVPPIDILRVATDAEKRPKLSERQHKALSHYRDRYALARGSEVQSCLKAAVPGGGGDGPSGAVLRARVEIAYLDRELGTLRDITAAVAGCDITLSQWAIDRFGALERKDAKGRPQIEAKPHALKRALAEIKMAGERLDAAIEAGRDGYY